MALKWIALAALLLTLPAAAELRQADVCGNGRTHQQSYCPAVLSSPTGTQTGATTGNVGATSDQTDGTRYACAASSATPLTCNQIQACSGGTAVAGSSAAETGSNSIALTGLTTDAAHYGQSCNESPEDWDSNVVVSSSFTPVEPGSAPYDLSGLTGIAWTPVWPTEPTTSGTVNVTASNCSSLQGAFGTAARVVNIPAGTYNSCPITISSNDIDVVMSNTATINGSVDITGDRVRWTGGNVNTGSTESGEFRVNNADDVLLNDLNIYGRLETTSEVNRFAFVESTVTGFSQSEAHGDFVWFASPAGASSTPGGAGRLSDWIVANSVVWNGTGNAANRFQYTDRLLIVDSYLGLAGTNTAGLRLGDTADNTHVEGLAKPMIIIRHVFGSLNGGGLVQFTDANFENVDLYSNSNAVVWCSQFAGNPPNTGTVSNSRLHSNTGGTGGAIPFCGNVVSGGGNATVQAYSTAPSSATYGAQR